MKKIFIFAVLLGSLFASNVFAEHCPATSCLRDIFGSFRVPSQWMLTDDSIVTVTGTSLDFRGAWSTPDQSIICDYYYYDYERYGNKILWVRLLSKNHYQPFSLDFNQTEIKDNQTWSWCDGSGDVLNCWFN
jgi:hypothetical protein